MAQFDLRGVFIELSPELSRILTFELPLVMAVPVIIAISAAAGALGAAVHLLPRRLRRSLLAALAWVLTFGLLTDLFSQLFTGLSLDWLTELFFGGRGRPLTMIGALIVFVLFGLLYW